MRRRGIVPALSPLPHGRPQRIGVFVAVLLIPVAAQLATGAAWPSLRRFDPDDAFLWITTHHVLQLALVLVALPLAFGVSWRRAGFNLDNAATTARWLGWFALAYLGWVLLFHAGDIAAGGRPFSSHPLEARNVVGVLGFQLLLSGTAEEPLYRGLVMTVLGRTWDRVLRLGRFEMPVTGLIATALFMLAHVRWTAVAPFVEISLYQQFLSLVLGLFYAALFHRTKSLAGPIVAHGYSNLVAVGVRYILGA